jgi:hypothetical protein
MNEATNGLFDCESMFDRWGRSLRERLSNIEAPEQKATFLQRELVPRLRNGVNSSRLVARSVALLWDSAGLISIRQLERDSGYSRRYRNAG